MKIRYKHQGFQAEAARNVVRAFGGQPFYDSANFIMDWGTQKHVPRCVQPQPETLDVYI